MKLSGEEKKLLIFETEFFNKFKNQVLHHMDGDLKMVSMTKVIEYYGCPHLEVRLSNGELVTVNYIITGGLNTVDSDGEQVSLLSDNYMMKYGKLMDAADESRI